MMPGLTRRYPRAIGLVEEAARAGERGEVVHTLLGRGSPVPRGRAERPDEPGEPPDAGESAEDRDRHRRAWGRFTRNFVVQGTAAEWALCWLADLRNRLWRLGGAGAVSERPHLVFFLHDEVVVHTPEHLADAVVEEVRRAAGEAGRLLFGGVPHRLPAGRRGRPVLGRRRLSAPAGAVRRPRSARTRRRLRSDGDTG